MSRLPTTITAAILTCLAMRAGAQANPDSVKHRNDCRLAAQTLTTGQPAPKTDWALTIIGSCGSDGAQALAAVIRNSRSSVDTGFLSNLRQQAGYFADGGIFASALGVAGDPTASVPARVFALLTLQSIITPRSPSTYAEATTGIDAGGAPACTRITRDRSDPLVRPGSIPLPADYAAQGRALATSLQQDANAPAIVRAAAQCVL